MKKPVLTALFLALAALAFAESSDVWEGYVTYSPKSVATSVGVQDADLGWLGDLAKLVGPGGSTFLGRRDTDHWMALANQKTGWLLQVHDETARFNFRALVDPKTGLMTVIRGVEWKGLDRKSAAAKAADLAVGYIQRARKAEVLFQTDPMVPLLPQEKSRPLDRALGTGGDELWQRLADGNLRFVSGKVDHPHQSMEQIAQTAKTQSPFALVVCCSDSRVPPEILFDQGIGDLYVVRTAAETVSALELGTIEEAVDKLGIQFIVVLAHKGCLTVAEVLKGGDPSPDLEAIAEQVRPAVQAARFFPGDYADNVIRENAHTVVDKLKTTPDLAKAMAEGRLILRAAYYDVDTGQISVLQ